MEGRMHASPDCQTSSDVAVTCSKRSSSPAHDDPRRHKPEFLLEPALDINDRVDRSGGVEEVDVTGISAWRQLHDHKVRQHLTGADIDVRGVRVLGEVRRVEGEEG